MVISFDLDDTIIPGAKRFETEKRSIFQKLLGIEKIRAGTIKLMNTCQSKGHEIYIYTTSLRSINKIRWTFYTYGIKLDKVINLKEHERVLSGRHLNSSKYPPAFNIDFHIDDSKGVEIEGQRFNFRTIIISHDNINWTDDVLNILH